MSVAATLALTLLTLASACEFNPFLPIVVERPARSMRITRVLAYQAHQSVLYEAESESDFEPDQAPEVSTPPEIPLLANRKTMVRVMVQPVDGEVSGQVLGRMRLRSSPGADEVVLETKALVFTPSAVEVLNSSIVFVLDAEMVTPATTLQIALFETRVDVATDEQGEVDAPYSRWPESGRARLRPQDGPTLRVHLVPLLVPSSSDGEELRDPSPDAELLERFHHRLLDILPVSSVIVDVGAPLSLETPLDAYGDGWPSALAAIAARRQQDIDGLTSYEPVDGTEHIYFGLVAPTERRSQFCPLSCLQGLTLMSEDTDNPFARIAMGLAFDDDNIADAFVHEIGHTLGRMHAPCDVDVDTVDPDYPHPEAKTGSWGWSAREERLRPPSDRDFMSYCAPRWISPYQSSHLLTQLRSISAQRLMSTTGRTNSAHASGSNSRALFSKFSGGTVSGFEWGPRGRSPNGRTSKRAITLSSSKRYSLRFLPYSHLVGGVYFVPENLVTAVQRDLSE